MGSYGRKTPRDGEYIAAYLRLKTLKKAAVECGVGTTTIHRALRRAGVNANGRTDNGGIHGGSPHKITTAELMEESKTMTRAEIAEKHKMNVCNIDRRLKRLGIKCKKATVCTRIGTSHHYSDRCKAYGVDYDKSVTLKRVIERDKGICQLCGKPVNTDDKVYRTMGGDYPSIDHIIPLSKGGSHTWDNVQLAHLRCNSLKGDRTEQYF